MDARWLAQFSIDDWIEVGVLVLVVAAAGARELIKFFSPKPKPEDQPDPMARKRTTSPPPSQARPVARPMPPVVVQRRTIIRTASGDSGEESSRTTIETVFPTAPAAPRAHPPSSVPQEAGDAPPTVPEEVASLPNVIFEMLGLPTPEAPRPPRSRQRPPRPRPPRRQEGPPAAPPRPASVSRRAAPPPDEERPHQRVVADALTPAALQTEQTARDASGGQAPPEAAHAADHGRPPGHDLRRRLHSHSALRESIALAEILGPPLGLRPFDERLPAA
ncbi:MAG: hypothetical protein HY763_00845 [Planctomycetes bacterium]|nr:hypothetical protein [Planctomycetota bacterium]